MPLIPKRLRVSVLTCTHSPLVSAAFHSVQRLRLAASVLAVVVAVIAPTRAQAPPAARAVPLTADGRDGAAMRRADDAINALLREGRLSRTARVFDTLVAGAEHQRLQQLHRGVPVWAATVTVQERGGIPVSAYGDVYEGLDDIDPAPLLSAADARALAARYAGVELGPVVAASLFVFVPASGAARLVYTVRATTGSLLTYRYFIDARTGALVEARLDTRLQSPAVGVGRGVIGADKKVMATLQGGQFLLADLLRPQQIRTFDMRGNVDAILAVLNGTRDLSLADLGADADNRWTDPALVDAHVYSGWAYDYLYKRFNRLGLDGVTLPIINIVHPVR